RRDLYAFGATLKALIPKLAAPPERATMRLVERLCHADPRERPVDVEEVLETLGAPRSALRPPPRVPRSLLGREREIDEVGGMLDRLEAGERGPRAIVLGGEPGAGKSRLVSELKWIAETRVTVCEGFATTPDAVRSLLDRASGGLGIARGPIGAIEARDR